MAKMCQYVLLLERDLWSQKAVCFFVGFFVCLFFKNKTLGPCNQWDRNACKSDKLCHLWAFLLGT